MDINDIQILQQQPEGQQFDRKSFRIDTKNGCPGILPGLVRIDNIRQMHFSRNPKIAEFMQQYKLVKEFGEGVDRMFREMAEAGNPAPEYKQVEFMVKVKLTSALRDEDEATEKTGEKSTQETESGQKTTKWPGKTREKTREKIVLAIRENSAVTASVLAEKLSITVKGVEWQLKKLQEQGIIRRVGPNKGGHWEVVEQNDNK